MKSWRRNGPGCAGANDMGLTLTSRCRLIAPPAAKEPENPFLQLLAEKERRQA